MAQLRPPLDLTDFKTSPPMPPPTPTELLARRRAAEARVALALTALEEKLVLAKYGRPQTTSTLRDRNHQPAVAPVSDRR